MTEPSTAKLRTRAQDDLRRAAQDIEALRDRPEKFKKNYLSRVKSFPALVMTVGLAQALAFSAEKESKAGDIGEAHRVLLRQVGGVLGVDAALQAVRNADALEYMHMTRRVLAAWTFYRRLAVSLLDPEDTLGTHGDDT